MSERKGICVIVPVYKRPEYTAKCLSSMLHAQNYPMDTCFYLVDDGSRDGSTEVLLASDLPNKHIVTHETNKGLRTTLIDFFEFVRGYESIQGFKYIVKMDNDCRVPKNWLNDIIAVLDKGEVDIVSPNVNPSNAAYTYGQEDVEKRGFRPSKIVGGLWAMRADLLEGINFEKHDVYGIKGAFHLLNQIILEKEPRVGWLPQVLVQDIGHWSGDHPEHIQSAEHRDYSVEVGRGIAW